MSSNVPNTIQRDSKESSMKSKRREMLASTFKTMLKRNNFAFARDCGHRENEFYNEKKHAPASNKGYLLLLVFATDLPNETVTLPVLLLEASGLLRTFCM